MSMTGGETTESDDGLPDLGTTVIFTDPTITAGSGIKAAHITELREGVL